MSSNTPNTPMEIERKFLIDTQKMPIEQILTYPHHVMEQAYLCTAPVVRIRREDDTYYLTYKNGPKLAHTEYNLPLDRASYEHLLAKADGHIIRKTRYLIPLEYGLTCELDIFAGDYEGLVFAEVEFPSLKAAEAFEKPDWLTEDVTMDEHYSNSYLSKH